MDLGGGQHVTKTIDLRPGTNALLQVQSDVDTSKRQITWVLNALDPTTLQLPSNPQVGILPPNKNPPQGEGYLTFTASARHGTPENTTIFNQATITFDVNPPIQTNVWSNTLDNTPPTSHVLALPSSETSISFTVQWTGTDVGSGIQDFTIYVSDNSGAFGPFLSNTAATSAMFAGQAGHTYGFYSIARDLVGNLEASKNAAEATTEITTDTTPPVTTAVASPAPNGAGWNNANVTITLDSTDNEPGGSGVKQIQWSLAGAQTGSSTVPGNTTTVTISTEGTTTLTYFGTDNAGNIETIKTITINLDKTPPTVVCGASPNMLWPPDNKLVPINVSVIVTDSLSGAAGFTLVSVTSSEPDSGQGDIQRFTLGTASTTGQLRAQRLGSGTGRVYTLNYAGTDKAGNSSTCSATVTVPHDQGTVAP
jgi:hypothetical protein